jgi:hypothetical protein
MTNGLSSIIGEHNVAIPDKNGEFNDSFGYVPMLRIKPDLNFTHGNLLLDLHLGGSFHITGGAFLGKSQLLIDGRLVNSKNNNENSILLPGKTWPVIEVGDQEIELTDGQANNIDILLGNTLKPYLGLGFGRAVPKKRLSLKFELGVVFQKGYSLRQDGIVFDLGTSDEQEVKDIHNIVMKYAKVWPMVNLQLSYRIF